MDLKNQSQNHIKRIILPVVSATVILLVLFLLVPQPVRAATRVVSNSNDTGIGSLRWAIDYANSNPGLDIITFTISTNGTPINLVGAAGEDANGLGDLDILDKGDLIIQGNGTTNTIIDGGSNDRVIHICPGGGCTNTITITGVTIRNGSASPGGGIYNQSGTLILDGSKVNSNSSTGHGGGIYNGMSGLLTVQSSSVIIGNSATTDGGGIFNAAGSTWVDGSTVKDNDATNGGGIFNWEEGTLYVQNGSTIGGSSASAANTATDDGGGIYNQNGGTTTVDGSKVSSNAADNGGGIYNNAAIVNIQNNSTIGGPGAGNDATSFGGGVYNAANSTLTIDSSIVSTNTAGGGGRYL